MSNLSQLTSLLTTLRLQSSESTKRIHDVGTNYVNALDRLARVVSEILMEKSQAGNESTDVSNMMDTISSFESFKKIQCNESSESNSNNSKKHQSQKKQDSLLHFPENSYLFLSADSLSLFYRLERDFLDSFVWWTKKQFQSGFTRELTKGIGGNLDSKNRKAIGIIMDSDMELSRLNRNNDWRGTRKQNVNQDCSVSMLSQKKLSNEKSSNGLNNVSQLHILTPKNESNHVVIDNSNISLNDDLDSSETSIAVPVEYQDWNDEVKRLQAADALAWEKWIEAGMARAQAKAMLKMAQEIASMHAYYEQLTGLQIKCETK